MRDYIVVFVIGYFICKGKWNKVRFWIKFNVELIFYYKYYEVIFMYFILLYRIKLNVIIIVIIKLEKSKIEFKW